MVFNKDGILADYMDDESGSARRGRIESWTDGDSMLTVAVERVAASCDYPAVIPMLSINEELLNAWPAMEVDSEPETGGASGSRDTLPLHRRPRSKKEETGSA